MDVRVMKQIIQSATAGSVLVLSAGQLVAGKLCPDQPTRPHVSAADAQNWGYNPTCWQRFPPVQPCDGSFGCGMNGWMGGTAGTPFAMPPAGYGEMTPGTVHDGMIYAPQSGLIVPDHVLPPMSQSMSPQSMSPQHAGSGRYGAGLELPAAQIPQVAPPMNANPTAPVVPSPEVRTFDSGPPANLPPLPKSPSQSSVLPNRLMIQPNGRVGVVPVATASQSAVVSSSRYGTPVQPASQSTARPGMASGGSRYGVSAPATPRAELQRLNQGGRYR